MGALLEARRILRLTPAHPGEHQWHRHVVDGDQIRQKLPELEDEPELAHGAG